MQDQSTHCECGCGVPLNLTWKRKKNRGGVVRFLRGHQIRVIKMRPRRTYKGLTREQRFWAKVEKSEGCWLWTGSRDKGGYGRANHKGGTTIAHRQAYEMLVGPIGIGLCLLHTCDNPPCVRPDHLVPGTYLDNTRDSQRKGRRPTNPEMSATQIVLPVEVKAMIEDRSRQNGISFQQEAVGLLRLAMGDYVTIGDRTRETVAERASLSQKWRL